MKKKLIITLLILLALLFIVLIYNNYYSSHNIKVLEYAIKDKKLPEEYHGLKIVHFSDVLYGKSANDKDLENVNKKINETNPDIVIFTGDLFVKDIKLNEKELKKIKKILDKINVKYEKYAILGDNDKVFKDSFYQVFSDSWNILDNESQLIYINSETPIRITGINNYKKEELFSEDDKLFNILITHKPDEIENLKNKYNLIFAGHSIGGQINMPFYGPLIKLKGAKKYSSGKYTISDETTLFVNDGIGSQNTNMRINNSPKINFYRLYTK